MQKKHGIYVKLNLKWITVLTNVNAVLAEAYHYWCGIDAHL